MALTLAELITAITEHAETEDTREALVDAIRKDAKTVYHDIFEAGHARARGRDDSKLTKMQGELDTAKTAVADLTAKLTDAEKGVPEINRVRGQYEATITDLRTKLATDEAGHKAAITELRLAGDHAALRAALVNEFKVHPDYAEVLVAKKDVASRIRYAEDGVREVLAPNREIALPVKDGEDPIRELARTLAKTVEPVFITSNVAAGSGTRNGGGHPGSKNVFDAVREKIKQEVAAAPPPSDRLQTLNGRMGRTAPPPVTGAAR